MKGIQVNPPFEEKASRMELLVRIPYMIVYYIVALIGGFVMMFTWPLQLLAILILGKRIVGLHKFNRAMVAWFTDYMAYFYAMTDERPKFIPEFD